MPAYKIAMYTDIGEKRVWEILVHFQKTGSVNVPKCEKIACSRSLCDEEIQVSDSNAYTFVPSF